ncbi:hypothetical protein HPB48_021938 [Haemaphysalis longicornis]|uniref:CCHC-type domain-containing protein n=1 Tax=Haemaphysalis longicornis TaxID=44386 RepID=A0A9J6GL66_HAELO|nr:hypothetical protein HPB48_021938 [Haemaphysalis longicornis]
MASSSTRKTASPVEDFAASGPGISQMQVEVEGEEITTEDFQEGSGWTHVVRKPKTQGKEAARPATPERQSRPRERNQYAKRVIASTARASKMPNVLPREDIKIVVRPRGGLNIAKLQATVATAIRAAAGVSREDGAADTFCPNVHQNIVVVSTPDEGRARAYARIQSIRIGDRVHEVGAYQTTPDGTVKGIIRGVPVEDTPAEIHRNIVHPRNPLARGAQRIGNTTTVIVAFEGLKVPNYVCYETVLLRCSLYRKHIDVCRQCGRVGHRRDVCPNPSAKVCFDCGVNNPTEEHDFKVNCRICGGPHPTGDRDCKHRYKVPYVVTRRQWERKMEEQRARRQLPNPDEFPELRTSVERATTAATERSTSRSRKNSRGRSASRQRGRSKSGERVSWADATKAGIRKRGPSLQQSPGPSGGGNSGDKKGDKRDEEMELLKKNVVMLTRANELLNRKVAELVAALDKSNKEVMALKLGLPGRPTPTQQLRRSGNASGDNSSRRINRRSGRRPRPPQPLRLWKRRLWKTRRRRWQRDRCPRESHRKPQRAENQREAQQNGRATQRDNQCIQRALCEH